MFDLGGGSMQIAGFRARQLGRALSLPLGALRLSDAFLTSDPPFGGRPPPPDGPRAHAARAEPPAAAGLGRLAWWAPAAPSATWPRSTSGRAPIPCPACTATSCRATGCEEIVEHAGLAPAGPAGVGARAERRPGGLDRGRRAGHPGADEGAGRRRAAGLRPGRARGAGRQPDLRPAAVRPRGAGRLDGRRWPPPSAPGTTARPRTGRRWPTPCSPRWRTSTTASLREMLGHGATLLDIGRGHRLLRSLRARGRHRALDRPAGLLAPGGGAAVGPGPQRRRRERRAWPVTSRCWTRTTAGRSTGPPPCWRWPTRSSSAAWSARRPTVEVQLTKREARLFGPRPGRLAPPPHRPPLRAGLRPPPGGVGTLVAVVSER